MMCSTEREWEVVQQHPIFILKLHFVLQIWCVLANFNI